MKKLTTLGFVLCLTSTAAFADLSQGDGTYLPKKEFKSSVSRDAVVAKTDSRNVANSLDGTYAPASKAASNVSRAEVVNKMQGYQYADFGDGTSAQPWTRTQEAPRSLANKASDASGKNMN
jgi:hypothetical protein